MEELPEKARHQPAVHPLRILGFTAQKIVNTFSATEGYFQAHSSGENPVFEIY